MTTKIDFTVENHGTIWVFRPHTEAAIEWAHEAFPEETPTWGSAYAVEHRYAPPIVEDLRERGFVLAPPGRN